MRRRSRVDWVILLLWIVLLVGSAESVHGASWFSCDGKSFCGGSTTNYSSGRVDANVYHADAPDGDGRVWQVTHYQGIDGGGHGIADVNLNMPAGKNEVWVQYYWKYSDNYTWHDVGQKQMRFNPSNTIPMVIMGSKHRIAFHPQECSGCTIYYPNVVDPATLEDNFYGAEGEWHKYTGYYKMSTDGASDGVYKAWVDDVLIADYTGVRMNDPGEGNTFTAGNHIFAIVWGGISTQTMAEESYLWLDAIYVGDTDPRGSAATFTYTANMDSYPFIGGGYSCVNRSPDYGESILYSSAPGPTKVLHGHIAEGSQSGGEPFACFKTWESTETKIYQQYYFRYSSNYQYNYTYDKHTYIDSNNVHGSLMIGVRKRSDGKVYLTRAPSGTIGGSYEYPNQPGSTVASDLQYDTWYKVTLEAYSGTANTANGWYKIWVNDTLSHYYTGIQFLKTGDSGWTKSELTPVWGGSSTQYAPAGGMDLYFDTLIISDAPIDAGGESDTTPPYISSRDPSSNETGVPITSRTVTRVVADSGDGVLQSSLVMGINGANKTCAVGMSCTGTSSAYTLTYTHASDWDYNQNVVVTVNATDLAENVMPTDTTMFTTEQAPSGSRKTKAELLTYFQGLANLPSKKLLSGQRIGSLSSFDPNASHPILNDSEFENIAAKAGGKLPAIAGFDLACEAGLPDCDDSDGIARAIEHWNAGGLVHFTWHAANPANNNEWEWPLREPYFTPFSQVYTPGNTIYNNFRAQLEHVGDVLETLQDNGVVVTLAPFHEMNNHNTLTSFWWDGRDAAQYRTLWEYTRHYLEVERGLSNIIWVYAITRFYNPTEYYPGDNNVDIVGIDYYSVDGTMDGSDAVNSNVRTYYSTLQSAYPNKPFAFTEAGQCLVPSGSYSGRTTEYCSNQDARRIVNDISTYFPKAIWWMNWDDGSSVWYGFGNHNYVNELMSDSRVVTLQDNPSGAAGASSLTILDNTLGTLRVGTYYYRKISSVYGTGTITYSVVAGALPAGLSFTSTGEFVGTPSAAGAYSFTIQALDEASNTDTQVYSGTVLPYVPGGSITTTSFTLTDTYVKSGAAATTNFSNSTTNRLYQWPAYTPANRSIIQIASLGLPDNVTINEARVYMYLESWEGTGGTTPMRVYAKPVVGQTWGIDNVTWNLLDNSVVGTYESYTDVPTATGWYSWEVTQAASTAYTTSAPLTILFDGGENGASDTNRYFTSVDGTAEYIPYLSITYTLLVSPEGPTISVPGSMRVVNFKGFMGMK